MPVFFVDICHKNSLIEDMEGIEFLDVQAAEAHCVAGLIALAKDLVAGNVLEHITMTLHDQARNLILERTLTLTCELS